MYYKKRLGRVDRNKSSDITEDKMRKDSTRSCTLSGTRDGASSENKSGRRRRRGDEGKKRASHCRLFGWFLSRERNCGCLSNLTDRNSISSCVASAYRTASFSLSSARRSLPLASRSFFFSSVPLFPLLTLIYFIRAILAVYATYPRPHRAPAHGDKLWHRPGKHG